MKGEVVYFFAFDVANDVLPDRVGVVLGQRPLPLELRLELLMAAFFAIDSVAIVWWRR